MSHRYLNRRILIAEGDENLRQLLRTSLRSPGFNLVFVNGAQDTLQAFKEERPPDAVILDGFADTQQALQTLRALRQVSTEVPIITLCQNASVQIVEAVKNGATDVLTKPVGSDQLQAAVERLVPALEVSDQEDAISTGFGHSAWSRCLDKLMSKLALSDVPVLLNGETGVGKEVLARTIHAQSRRADRTFLKLNCAALPSELVESELFGYERGAFTGAFKNNPGKFEIAAGGTILLDEIGDMDLKLQAKLLHVLQDHQFLRLGSREPTHVDVRVISATHQNLEEAVVAGRFREDLYYRLNVISITIPPLQERQDEIIPLAQHFLRLYAAPDQIPEIDRPLRRELLAYSWPGNVRELENLMRKYVVLTEAEVIVEDLQQRTHKRRQASKDGAGWEVTCAPATNGKVTPAPAPNGKEAAAPSHALIARAGASADSSSPLGVEAETTPAIPRGSPLERVEEIRRRAETEAILNALQSTLWNRKRAAAVLGTDYKALLYKMKKLGIGEDEGVDPKPPD